MFMTMRSMIMCVLTQLVSISAIIAQPAQRFDVLIDELFPDPSPSVGLPNSEFLELKNNSGRAISLKNWKISDGSSTATISSNFILGIDSFVIICASSSQSSFSIFGSTIGVTSFPSLNNDADQLILISPEGSIIHAIQYDFSWYQNDLKKEGGWSMEMIDTKNPCNGANNWMASTDKLGGTPGKRNSISASNPDEMPPALLRAYAIDSISIVLVFDESLDSASASILSHYSINNIPPIKATPLAPFFKEVKMILRDKLVFQKTYPVNTNDIMDCAGNTIGLLHSCVVGLPEPISKNELVINEILFNPLPEGVDYIELYNNSNKIGDLSKLYVANRNSTGNLTNTVVLSATSYLFFPGDYLTFTENKKTVERQYNVKSPQLLIELPSMPSLPDDKGQLVLLNEQGVVVDEVPYDQQWHFALLASKDGVALERMDFSKKSDDKNNWTSAASTSGYGTPTYRNSQFHSSQQLQGNVSVTPKVFSPNNDGYDDFAQVNYSFTQNNLVGNISIFDINGRMVRVLANQATLSLTGSFRWDGMSDQAKPLPSGIYVILFEVFGLNGNKETHKKVISLVRNLKI